MIKIQKITENSKADINLPNEPFSLHGKMIPNYTNGQWGYEIIHFAPEDVTEMCFPDEDYVFEELTDDVFIGAYDGDKCIGLAILEPGFFKYMYLSDLKVNSSYRGQHVGSLLMEEAKKIALGLGYKGLYTIGQDNNVDACLFYLGTGFHIGGFDTNVYKHTVQEGKSDIIFYCEG